MTAVSPLVLPESPYKGLSPFGDTDLDALLFFGREREREVIAANLVAARLTVLYGPSGVGKSSVLRAGVARDLRALPERPLVAVHATWSEDPAPALARTIAAAAGIDPGRTLVESVERALLECGELFLILDQLEEYFLYHPSERGAEGFAESLPELVARRDLPVHVLLSIREESLARLDAFKPRLPGLFANSLRLDHLDRAAARRAVEGPLEAYGRLVPGAGDLAVGEGLVEAVLDQVEAGKVVQGGGRGVVRAVRGSRRVETPYLQLVMQRLWEEERAAGSNVLRLETLERLGGAGRIVEGHLARALARLTLREKAIAAGMFNHLVTPSGTKIAHGPADLAEYADASEETIAPVLRALVDERILRPVSADGGDRAGYEIFHDVLAEAVLAWRSRYEAERAVEAERAAAQRRHRRLAAVAAAALVAFLAMALLAAYAFAQRQEAQDRQRAAEAGRLAATALTELARDPEVSLALGVEASSVESSPRIDDVIRTALLESRVRSVARLGRSIEALDIVPGGGLVAATDRHLVVLDEHLRRLRTLPLEGRLLGVGEEGAIVLSARGLEVRSLSDGTLRRLTPIQAGALLDVRNVTTGRVTRRLRMPERVRFAALGPRGTLLAVSDGTRRTVVIDARTGHPRYELVQPSAVTALAWGPGSRLLATGGKDGTARLWTVSSGRQRAVLRGHRGWVVDLAFSPRATLVASASRDGTGRIWRLSGEPVSTLAGHTLPLRDVAFGPDGESVVTASDDGTARVWKVDTSGQLSVLRGHRGPVDSARFVARGLRVATAGEDGSVRLWDPLSQPRLGVLARLDGPVERIRSVGEGSALVDAGGRSYLVARGREPRAVRRVPPGPVRAPDGTTARVERDVVVLRRPNGEKVVLRGHTGGVTSVRFSRGGKLAVTASRDHTARVWVVATGTPLRVLRGHFSIVSDAAFSPDGRWVVTAGPGTAGLFRVSDGRLFYLLSGHNGILTAVAFDPAGRTIVTGGVDGTVRTYDCEVCRVGRELADVARGRLAATGRVLTAAELRRLVG